MAMNIWCVKKIVLWAYCISRTGLECTGFVKRGLVKRGLAKRGLVKRIFVKRGLVKHGFVKLGFVKLGFVKLGFVKRALEISLLIQRTDQVIKCIIIQARSRGRGRVLECPSPTPEFLEV